jgi:hypothetical protein
VQNLIKVKGISKFAATQLFYEQHKTVFFIRQHRLKITENYRRIGEDIQEGGKKKERKQLFRKQISIFHLDD